MVAVLGKLSPDFMYEMIVMDLEFSGQPGEYLYSIAAAFSCGAYLLKNMLWLRILLVIAATIYIVYGVSLGITSMIGWNSAYLLINTYHIVFLLLDRVTITLPTDTRKVYQLYFSSLSTREFKKLISNNRFAIVQDDVIIEESEIPQRLFIILRGRVEIMKSGQSIAILGAGDFIGEMSFLSKEPASASAYARELVQYAYWTRDDLEKLQRKDIKLYNKFVAVVGCDLVRKLKNRNDSQVEQSTRLDFVI